MDQHDVGDQVVAVICRGTEFQVLIKDSLGLCDQLAVASGHEGHPLRVEYVRDRPRDRLIRLHQQGFMLYPRAVTVAEHQATI